MPRQQIEAAEVEIGTANLCCAPLIPSRNHGALRSLLTAPLAGLSEVRACLDLAISKERSEGFKSTFLRVSSLALKQAIPSMENPEAGKAFSTWITEAVIMGKGRVSPSWNHHG
jgi:hypothetical protein